METYCKFASQLRGCPTAIQTKMLWCLACVLLCTCGLADATQFQKSLCGPVLSDALAVICQGHYATSKRSGISALFPSGPLVQPQLSVRSRRDISHSCCTNRCSLADLALYCEEGYGSISSFMRVGTNPPNRVGLIPSDRQSAISGGQSGPAVQALASVGRVSPQRFGLWRNNPGFFFVTPAKVDGLLDAAPPRTP